MSQNPAWRTYKYAGKKKQKRNVADEETTKRLIAALEKESIKYETYFKLIIATGMRRGECCGLKWKDVDFFEKSIHICRNVVKVTGEDIIVKEPKTAAGDRYVYFSLEMASLLKEYRSFCQGELELHEGRSLTPEDYIFRRHGENLPMTPSTFTWRFKLILKKHGLPLDLNVHSLRHTAASLMISGGADVATVSGILGHAQVSTTLDIYTHAFDEKKREVSAEMQEMCIRDSSSILHCTRIISCPASIHTSKITKNELRFSNLFVRQEFNFRAYFFFKNHKIQKNHFRFTPAYRGTPLSW